MTSITTQSDHNSARPHPRSAPPARTNSLRPDRTSQQGRAAIAACPNRHGVHNARMPVVLLIAVAVPGLLATRAAPAPEIDAVAAPIATPIVTAQAPAAGPTRPEPGGRPCTSRCIAMEYEVWFPNVIGWTPRWGTPILGTYNSTDVNVIDKHAEWFNALGVDFLIVDWSNSSQNYVAGRTAVDADTRANTDALFAEYEKLSRQGKPHPRIAILLGAQDEGPVKQRQVIDSGALQDEANYVYRKYVERYPDIYFPFDGKPLLPVYVLFNGDPGWRDSRFNIRMMSAGLESQYAIYSHASSNTMWSWYDRDPIPSYNKGAVESATVTQAYPGTNGWTDSSNWPPWDPRPARGRRGINGQSTFSVQWTKAVNYNPRIIILNEWNDFQGGNVPIADQYTPELSNDIEPTVELGCAAMSAIQLAVAKWKGITLPSIDCSASLSPNRAP